MKTDFKRVSGLGSAKTGTEDFIKDRLRSVILLILTPYMIGLGIYLFGRPLAVVTDTVAKPWIGVPIALYLLIGVLHMRLGMQTIIEDYIHANVPKLVLTLANLAFCLAMASAIVFALLKIMLVETLA